MFLVEPLLIHSPYRLQFIEPLDASVSLSLSFPAEISTELQLDASVPGDRIVIREQIIDSIVIFIFLLLAARILLRESQVLLDTLTQPDFIYLR